MKRSKHTPLWPYLGVVWCLFVLSLAAPRSWRTIAVDPEVIGRPNSGPVAQAGPLPSTLRVSHATSGPQLGRADASPTESAKPAANPSTETIASGRTRASTVRVENSLDRLAMRPIVRPDRNNRVIRLPEVDLSSPPVDDRPRSLLPVPESLLTQLSDLSLVVSTSEWAIRTAATVRQLTSEPPPITRFTAVTVGDDEMTDATLPVADETSRLLNRLAAASTAATELAETLDESPTRTQLRRTQHALERRLDVWRLVYRLHQAGMPEIGTSSDAGSVWRGPHLKRSLDAVAPLIEDSESGRAWNGYLMLAQLADLATTGEDQPHDEAQRLARRILAHIERARMTDPQRQFVQQDAIVALAKELQHWAVEPVDVVDLLARVEQFEQHDSAIDAKQLAQDSRSLYWSPDADRHELGRRLTRHYRNANLRVALSGDLIARLLPPQKDIDAHVYDNILGADVEGVSRTSSRLAVTLTPDRQRIRIGLEAHGQVHSDTASYAGPATFYSLGSTSFEARKQFLISPRQGLQSWPAQTDAYGDADVMGLDTSYDGIPILGGFVRRRAMSEQRKSHGMAVSEVEYRVASRASERLDAEADRRLREMEQKVSERFIKPLRNLSLEPTPIDMHTTSRRAVMRVRLAGTNQLGAHTPRPRAPSDSFLSVQLHQSAINNAVENLQLDGKEMRLQELYQTVTARVQGLDDISEVKVPDDIPYSAWVRMADENAIRVRFENGQAVVTLGIAEVRFRKLKIPNVLVHAFYEPQPEGLHARLVRTGPVHLETDKHLKARDQIVLRTMFAKLLSKNRPIELIRGKLIEDPRVDDLQIHQFVVDEGWIGLAAGPPRVQARRTPTTAR